MIEAIIVSLATKTLCVSDKCWPVIVNQEKTIKGIYDVEAIYFNTEMKTPIGTILKVDQFGGVIIDLKATDISVHSWTKPLTGQSSGCIRMSEQDVNELIDKYYFNKIIIE